MNFYTYAIDHTNILQRDNELLMLICSVSLQFYNNLLQNARNEVDEEYYEDEIKKYTCYDV